MRKIFGFIAAHLTAGQFAALADPGTLAMAASIDTRAPGKRNRYARRCGGSSDNC